jgi:EAL domain-containing protein (putative c-di-GMP-specific phosphodiesterase class I)
VFVKDILDDPIDMAMVRSIYDVARAMNKLTIAESVDDAGVLEKLR